VPSVARFDAGGRLGKASRTPTGGVRVPATVARTGVQVYTRPDGTPRREYRPLDEVGSQASLDSYAGAAVTIGHPSVPVNSGNWDRLSAGTVSDRPARLDAMAGSPDRWVHTDLLLLRADAIARADSADLSELSVGYSCELEEASGETDAGEKYDAIQRNIRVNHVALLAPGCARAGRHAKLRLDGSQEPFDDLPPTPRVKMPALIKVDGSEVEVNSPNHVLALTSGLAVRDARLVKADADLKAAEVAQGALQAKFDGAEKERVRLAAELAKLDELVEARGTLLSQVAPVLGKDYAPKGKTASQIKRDALAKLSPALKLDGKSDVYVDAYFDAAVSTVKTSFVPVKADAAAAQTEDAACDSGEAGMVKKSKKAREESFTKYR
jgi:hypothetical protein